MAPTAPTYSVYVIVQHQLRNNDAFTTIDRAKAAAYRGAETLHNAGQDFHIIVADTSKPLDLTKPDSWDPELEICTRLGRCRVMPPRYDLPAEPLSRGTRP